MTTPMTCEAYQTLLPDFLKERGLAADRREAAEHHRRQCAACRALTADLRAITAAGAELPLLSPSRELWPGIEARIEAPVVPIPTPTGVAAVPSGAGGPSVRTRPGWRLAIAASALIAVTAGITYSVTMRVASAPVAPLAQGPGGQGLVQAVSRPSAEETFDREIAALRTIVDARRGELDTTTVTILQKNLGVIDAAIAESKAALAADPASAFLIDRVNSAYSTKLEMLRAIATLPARS